MKSLKLKALLAVLAIIIFAVIGYAQPPPTLWSYYYGGTFSDFFEVLQENDGGFVACGTTGNADPRNGLLVRTDAYGTQTWSSSKGGSGMERFFSVTKTNDGGYATVGYTSSYGVGSHDAWLVKTNSLGITTWSRTYGWSNSDEGDRVRQTGDGGYIIAGITDSYAGGDALLIKTDSQGNPTWIHNYGGSYSDGAYGLTLTSDGGYVFVGYNTSVIPGNQQLWLVKTDAIGTIIWSRTYGGNYSDKGCDIKETLDGGFIIVGTKGISAGNNGMNAWLIKTNSEGIITWDYTFGGLYLDEGQSVCQTSDHGYIFSGYTCPSGAGGDGWVVKTDSLGAQIWSQTYGTGNDDAIAIEETTDGGYIVAGSANYTSVPSSQAWLFRLAGPSNVEITLTPLNPPIVIPASGGSFNFEALLHVNSTTPQTFDAWIMQYTPLQQWQGPMLGPVSLTLPGGATVGRIRTQNVPGSAPPGVYTYRGFVGLYNTQKWDSSSFTYTKLASGDGPIVLNWENTGEPFPYEEIAQNDVIHNSSFIIHNLEISPNPFNPSTAISYELRAASYVSLKVYDTAGRLVSTLVNGYREAGAHEVTFDGSSLPSGVYLYRLETGEGQASGKMVLLK